MHFHAVVVRVKISGQLRGQIVAYSGIEQGWILVEIAEDFGRRVDAAVPQIAAGLPPRRMGRIVHIGRHDAPAFFVR